MTVHIEWSNPETDWDIYVIGPNGQIVTQSASFGDTTEDAVAVRSAAGQLHVARDQLRPGLEYAGRLDERERELPLADPEGRDGHEGELDAHLPGRKRSREGLPPGDRRPRPAAPRSATPARARSKPGPDRRLPCTPPQPPDECEHVFGHGDLRPLPPLRAPRGARRPPRAPLRAGRAGTGGGAGAGGGRGVRARRGVRRGARDAAGGGHVALPGAAARAARPRGCPLALGRGARPARGDRRRAGVRPRRSGLLRVRWPRGNPRR